MSICHETCSAHTETKYISWCRMGRVTIRLIDIRRPLFGQTTDRSGHYRCCQGIPFPEKPRQAHSTEYSFPLSEICGAPVYIKWENQQLCGSFKLRGALYKMNSLTPEERARGVVTCSSGNHGQGVALAAKELGIRTQIFVPKVCPETKKSAIKRRGGE